MSTPRPRKRRPAKRSIRGGSRKSAGAQIIQGLREAIAFERGTRTGARFVPAPISVRRADAAPAPDFSARDVASIRERLGVSQAVFARLLNVSPATTRAWEQGVNTPGGPASRLLQVAAADPEALLRYVRAAGRLSD